MDGAPRGKTLDPTLAPPSPTIWLTGVSGAGKSTLARGLVDRLLEAGTSNVVLLETVSRALR